MKIEDLPFFTTNQKSVISWTIEPVSAVETITTEFLFRNIVLPFKPAYRCYVIYGTRCDITRKYSNQIIVYHHFSIKGSGACGIQWSQFIILKSWNINKMKK